jgi:replication factor C subunit 3/5
MPLWVDKYRPKSLEQLTVHGKLNERLQSLVEGGDFPHLLFFGPSGAGKKTRVNAVLRHLFGPGASKVRPVLESCLVSCILPHI